MTETTETNTTPTTTEPSALIVLGYILAVAIPFIGFILGIVVATRPAKAVNKHGAWIIALSTVAFVVYLAAIRSGSGA